MINKSAAKKRKLTATSSSQKDSEASSHKTSLEKLKQSDPEFFKFLNNESKELLDFSMSESDTESGNNNTEQENKKKKAKTNIKPQTSDDAQSPDESDSESSDGNSHKPPRKLLVQSDSENETEESEDEETAEIPAKRRKDTRQIVTASLVKEWTTRLKSLADPSADNVLRDAVDAFCAAVNQASTKTSKDEKTTSKFKVEGSIVFNSIVRLLLTELLPTLTRVLRLPKPKHPNKHPPPTQSKQWPMVKSIVRQYLGGLIQLASSMAEADVVNALLKHMFQALPYFALFPKLIKALLRQLIVTWSRGEESSRVLAFLCINRIVQFHNKHLLDFAMKKMYTSYVKNCRFTTPTTLPLINFMQRSLTELFALNFTLSYQFAFVYIRQLAIHLRNAITVKKKDTQQVVYSWQFIHSLHFWSRTLSQLHTCDALKPLIYPLTQVILGTARLIPSARYYPLRFQCIRMLTLLSETTGTFIPVLPLLTEVFEITDFNKKHKNLSLKPFNFACILKFSNAQLDDKAFKDGIIDQVYELLMNYLHVYSHTVAFPELALPLTSQLRKFVKTCKVANYTKQIKQIVEKVEETMKVMTDRRKEATFSIADIKAVDEWEKKSKETGTPLSKYFSTWRKLRDQELQLEASSKEQISMDNLPVIVRPKGPQKATQEERLEFADIFKSDSEESDDETRFLLKEERPEKKRKSKADSDDDSSQYSDFDEEELEQLAKSASENEDSDEKEEACEDDSNESDLSDDDNSESDEKQKSGKKNKKLTAVSLNDVPDKDDIVEDFQMSSEEDDQGRNSVTKKKKTAKTMQKKKIKAASKSKKNKK